MEEFEEGEIVDSDSELDNTSKADTEVDWTETYKPLQRPVVSRQYCSTAKNADSNSSSSDGECSSNSSSDSEDNNIPVKQRKVKHKSSNNKRTRGNGRSSLTTQYQFRNTGVHAPKKKNDVWGSVLAEQILTHTMTQVRVNRSLQELDDGRNVETYDYILAAKYHSKNETNKEDEVNETESKRDGKFAGVKRSVQQRLGKKAENNEENVMEELEITSESTDKEVAHDIANKLLEPKEALIVRVVEVLGKQMAIDLYEDTKKVEESGGMMTVNGMRRRSPGGVYLQLLKKHEHIPREQIRKVFENDVKAREEFRKTAKAFRRNKKAQNVKKSIGATDSGETEELPRRMDLALVESLNNPPVEGPVGGGDSSISCHRETSEERDDGDVKCEEMGDHEDVTETKRTTESDARNSEGWQENLEKNLSAGLAVRTIPKLEGSDDEFLDIYNDVILE